MADSKYCTSCQRSDENIKAVSWCSDCSEHVCKSCAIVHEKMSPPHKVVPMEEIQQLSSSFLKLSTNCKNHPDQKFVLYCCQHDEVICASCVPVSHQNCKSIISLEKAAIGVKDSTAISDLQRRIDNISQVTENILSQTEMRLEDLSECRNKIKQRVSKIKQKVIAHLDKLEADILEDIDNKYTNCSDTVSRSKDNIKSCAISLSIWKNDLKSLKQHTSEIHIFQTVKSLDSKTHQKELEIRKIQTTSVPILAYHPSELESNIKKILQDLGTIKIDTVLVPMPMLDIFQQGQFSVSDERKLSLTHSFQTTTLGNEVNIYRGCFIPGNRLLLCQDGGRQLYVCQLNGSEVEIVNLDYTPERITLYDNNHAVVSSGWDGIQIIDLKTLKPGGIIRIEGNCDGITTVKDKILLQNKPNTLTIVDIKGKVQNTIITKFNPWEIFADKDGDVYCTDFDSDKVYVVTLDGQEREIYNSPDLKNPIGVAIDDRGDVYVAGGGSNTIHKISRDGQKHEVVLKADDGINGPTGLCYNCETRELLVINNNYSSINIYKT